MKLHELSEAYLLKETPFGTVVRFQNHSNETSSAVLSYRTICFVHCSNFLVCRKNTTM